MKRVNPAELPAIQRRDREALELAEREGIAFSEAYLIVLHRESLSGREACRRA